VTDLERIKLEVAKFEIWLKTNEGLIAKSRNIIHELEETNQVNTDVSLELLKLVEVQEMMQLQIEAALDMLQQFCKIFEEALGG